VALSGNGNFIAVGAYDKTVRIIYHITWRCLKTLQHNPTIDSGDVHVYFEEECTEDRRVTSKYGMRELPVRLTEMPAPQVSANPSIGVSLCIWSHDSKYLATRSDGIPNVLWIWDMTLMELAVVLVQFNAITSAAWSPESTHIAFSTGTERIYLWSMDGASICDVPIDSDDFCVRKVRWNSKGKCLALLDNEQAILAYPQPDFLRS
jgi:WD40 repeat protein